MSETPEAPKTYGFPIPVLTGRFVLVVALLGIFPFLAEFMFPRMGLGAVGLVIEAGIAFLLGFIDTLLSIPIRSLYGERKVDSPIVLGTESKVHWTITNGTKRKARIWLTDGSAPSLRAKPNRLEMTIPSGEAVRDSYRIQPVRRGAVVIEGPTIRSFGPLGLAGIQRRWLLPTKVLVNPAFPSRKVAELRLTDARRLFAGQRAVRITGDSPEFDYLREYTPDDDIRHINWAATARSQALIVEQTRAERNHQVVVLLDHSRLSAPTTRRFTPSPTVFDGPVVDLDIVEQETKELDNAPRLDHFIDATMALGLVTAGMGDRFGVVAYAAEVTQVLAPHTGRDQTIALSRMMAAIHPSWDEPDPLAAATWMMAHWKRRSLVVIMTDLAAEHARTRLSAAITRLSRFHQVMVVSPADPTVAMWASASPEDERGAMRMLAARRALERRHETARALMRMGVQVVDTPAGYMANRLLDAYLASDDVTSGNRVNVLVQRGWSTQLGHHRR